MEEMLHNLGGLLVAIGRTVMPFSFAGYFLVRWLEHFWGWRTSMAIGAKGLWYCLAGILVFTGDIYVETVVGYICFIETWDYVLSFRRGCLERKNKYKYSSTL
jgi:hypothetical protein